MTNPNIKEKEYTVALIGATSVGKTALVNRFTQDEFQETSLSTNGASFLRKMIRVDGYDVKFCIWDTAGQERFRSMTPMYYRQADVILVVYDVSNYESYKEMGYWIKQIGREVGLNATILIIGNKCDLEKDAWVVGETQLDYFEDYKKFLASAKTGTGVNEIFEYIATNVQGRQTETKPARVPKQDAAPTQQTKAKQGCC